MSRRFLLDSSLFFWIRRLQYDTASTTTRGVVLVLLVFTSTAWSSVRAILYPGTTARWCWTTSLLLVVSTDFADQVIECLIYIDPSFCRRFYEPTGEMVGQIASLCTCWLVSRTTMQVHPAKSRGGNTAHALLTNSTIHIQVAFVSYNNNREIILVLYP